jgi:hypothetical protein
MVNIRSSPNDAVVRSWSWRARCMLLILALLGVKLLFDAFNGGRGGDSYLKTFISADALVPKVDETPPDFFVTKAEDTTPELAAAAAAAAAHTPTFLSLAEKYGTDKVRGTSTLPKCREDTKHCPRPDAINEGCKVTGHFYDVSMLHHEKGWSLLSSRFQINFSRLILLLFLFLLVPLSKMVSPIGSRSRLSVFGNWLFQWQRL